ncbi:diguanylate cyclase domain-containing protein [Desulfomarina sp.]
MLNDLPCPAFELQPDARILRLNPLATKFFNCEHSSPINQFFQNFLEKKYRPDFVRILKRVKYGDPVQYEATLATQPGHAGPLTLKLSRLSNNNLLALVYQEKLLQSSGVQENTLLQEQYRQNPAGILLINDKMEMISYNSEFLRMWRIPHFIENCRNDLDSLETVIEQVCEPEVFMQKVMYLYEHPNEKSVDEIELRDGRTFYRHSYPVYNEEKYVGRIWYFLDITSLKQAQTELARQKKFQEAVLEHTRDGIVVCDAEGYLSLFNPASVKIHGADLQSVPQHKWTEYFSLFKPDGQTPLSMEEIPLSRALAGEKIRNEEIVIFSSDGKRQTLRVNGQAMYDNNGKKIGAVVTLHDITDLTRARQQLLHMAYHDSLTRLPNRRLFHDLLKQMILRARRNKDQIGILFLDLDNFKRINDSYGHERGDLFLIELSDSLQNTLRDSDILCRWGGDEFVIALPQITDSLDAKLVAEKLCGSVRTDMDKRYGKSAISISIGIALYPDHGEEPDQLIRLADMAMYTAKHRGKDRYCMTDTKQLLAEETTA